MRDWKTEECGTCDFYIDKECRFGPPTSQTINVDDGAEACSKWKLRKDK